MLGVCLLGVCVVDCEKIWLACPSVSCVDRLRPTKAARLSALTLIRSYFTIYQLQIIMAEPSCSNNLLMVDGIVVNLQQNVRT